mmetsp:Transcript_38947/g.99835  ORF Transcript_38947/g.99835 Transcript_38947/m.99835 type:complete len:207 (+) Transcript_38947:1171-1791(+)
MLLKDLFVQVNLTRGVLAIEEGYRGRPFERGWAWNTSPSRLLKECVGSARAPPIDRPSRCCSRLESLLLLRTSLWKDNAAAFTSPPTSSVPRLLSSVSSPRLTLRIGIDALDFERDRSPARRSSLCDSDPPAVIATLCSNTSLLATMPESASIDWLSFFGEGVFLVKEPLRVGANCTFSLGVPNADTVSDCAEVARIFSAAPRLIV